MKRNTLIAIDAYRDTALYYLKGVASGEGHAYPSGVHENHSGFFVREIIILKVLLFLYFIVH